MAVAMAPITDPVTRTLQASAETWSQVLETLNGQKRHREVQRLTQALTGASGPDAARRVTLSVEDARLVLDVAGVGG